MKFAIPDAFSVGWSRIDITPKSPTPLDGMGGNYVRKSNWIEPGSDDDRLMASVIVIADGKSAENTVLFCSMDTLFVHEFFYDTLSEKIADALGIRADHIFLSATHTHSGVAMNEDDESVSEYLDKLYPELVRAAEEAFCDLSEATVQVGSVLTCGMNAQRRYILKDGTHRSIVHDATFKSDDIVGYETTPDNTLRAIRFMRTSKKNIILVNWQMHPDFTCSSTVGRVSADVVGTFRKYVEDDPNENSYFAFFQGAGGNMSRGSRWQGDPYYDKMRSFDRESYCREIARITLKDIDYKNVRTGEIYVNRKEITVRQKKGKQLLDDTYTLKLNAVSFGDVALCTAPTEMFSDSGIELRNASRFAMTFLCTNTNGSYGYLPVKACFDGESYTQVNEAGDSFEVRVSRCEAGCAERIVEAL